MTFIPHSAFLIPHSHAQVPIDYRVSVTGLLDNREYGGPSPLVDETVFFVRPEAEFGLRAEGNNYIRGGLMYKQEFGAPETSENLDLLAYYHHDGGKYLQFRFGAFPRAGALDVPVWMFGDDAAYDRPFVHGAAVSVSMLGAEGSAWVDWTGRQTDTVRESFLFGYGMKYARGIYFARHDFMMYHLAAPGIKIPDDHVKDNGGMSIEVGAAWDGPWRLDTLSLSVGGVMSLDRDRADNKWHTPAGGFVSGYAGWKMLGLRAHAYKGDPQRMLWGDPFYRFDSFGRVDIIGRFVKKERVQADLFQSLHFYANKVGYSQHFRLKIEYAGRDPARVCRESNRPCSRDDAQTDAPTDGSIDGAPQ